MRTKIGVGWNAENLQVNRMRKLSIDQNSDVTCWCRRIRGREYCSPVSWIMALIECNFHNLHSCTIPYVHLSVGIWYINFSLGTVHDPSYYGPNVVPSAVMMSTCFLSHSISLDIKRVGREWQWQPRKNLLFGETCFFHLHLTTPNLRRPPSPFLVAMSRRQMRTAVRRTQPETKSRWQRCSTCCECEVKYLLKYCA
jgi:hypothetical protein